MTCKELNKPTLSGLSLTNVAMIVRRAAEYRREITENGCRLRGINYKPNKENTTPARISYENMEGTGRNTLRINNYETNTDKTILGLFLYALGRISMDEMPLNKMDVSVVFGRSRGDADMSVCTKHGPEKSKLMKDTNAILDDDELMKKLGHFVPTNLPVDLSELETRLLNTAVDGRIDAKTLQDFTKGESVTDREVFEMIEKIKAREDIPESMKPMEVRWPTYSFEEALMFIDEQVDKQMRESSLEITRLKRVNDENTAELNAKVEALDSEIQRLMDRSLWQRILNKKC